MSEVPSGLSRLEEIGDVARKWALLRRRLRSREFDMDGPGDQAEYERLVKERSAALNRIYELALACPNADCHHYPMYGMAPHRHVGVEKAEDFIGSTVVDPKSDWPKNFFEDPESPGCGTYTCPDCQLSDDK